MNLELLNFFDHKHEAPPIPNRIVSQFLSQPRKTIDSAAMSSEEVTETRVKVTESSEEVRMTHDSAAMSPEEVTETRVKVTESSEEVRMTHDSRT